MGGVGFCFICGTSWYTVEKDTRPFYVGSRVSRDVCGEYYFIEDLSDVVEGFMEGVGIDVRACSDNNVTSCIPLCSGDMYVCMGP